MTKQTLVAVAFGAALAVLLQAQTFTPLTPWSNLSGKTDSNGAVMTIATTAVGAQTPLTPFPNLRTRTDSNGALNVVVSTVQAGSGTGTLKISGDVCDSVAASCGCTTYADTATLNTWNLQTCTLPASTLATNGDDVEAIIDGKTANNANNKEFQVYWNGGTCGGTGAAACTTGTQLFDSTTATQANTIGIRARFKRSTSGNQLIFFTIRASTAFLNQGATTAAVTDTATIPVVLAARNTSAGAATLDVTAGPVMTLTYSPK